MAAQLKVIRDDKVEGKSSVKTQEATEELNYLMNFNQSTTFAMARTMQDLSDCVRQYGQYQPFLDSYLDHLKSGITHDTLRSAPETLHLDSLFPDNVIQKAEEENTSYDDKHYSSSSHIKRSGITPTLSLQGCTRHQPKIRTTSREMLHSC